MKTFSLILASMLLTITAMFDLKLFVAIFFAIGIIVFLIVFFTTTTGDMSNRVSLFFINENKAWIIFITLALWIGIMFSVLISYFFNNLYGAIAFVVYFLLITTISVVNAIKIVPQNENGIMEWIGQCKGPNGTPEQPWTPGIYFVFPFFGFWVDKGNFPINTQMIVLQLDEEQEKNKNGLGGQIDFASGESLGIKATAYLKIINAFKATYAVSDVYGAVEEKLDGAIRAILQKETYSDTSKIKDITIDDNFKTTLANWGVEVESVVITDIILSEAVQNARKVKVEAAAEKEAAVDKRAAKITLAEGERDATIKKAEGVKKSLELEGEGLAKQLEILITQGRITPEVASQLYASLKIAEKLNDKTVILGGESGLSSLIAQVLKINSTIKS